MAALPSDADKEAGKRAQLTAGLDTIDRRQKGWRGDSLYRESLHQLDIAAASSAAELVILDDEAPRELLEALGLMRLWLTDPARGGHRRRKTEGRRHGQKRSWPRWSVAIDPETAAERRAAMLADLTERRSLAGSRAAILAIVPEHG